MYRAKYIPRVFTVLMVALVLPRAANAHPMGNFSINHYSKIEVGTERVDLEYVIDMAEIPTFQETQGHGLVTDKNAGETAAYLGRQAEVLKGNLELEINGRRLHLDTVSQQVIFPSGAGGLPTMKMGFHFHTSYTPADAQAIALHYEDNNYPERAGWKEVVAMVSQGVILSKSSVPSQDRSAELSNYPTDLLHTPPQTLVADLTFKASPADGDEHAGSPGDMKLVANQQKTPRSAFTELITSNRTDLVFVLTAAVIAAMLGGFHAFEPGHGKTLVAAYLVGSHGTARHAVLLASVVTASHTISVYILGIITLFASKWIVPERLYPWLGAASGLLVAALGFTLFMRRFIATDTISLGNHSHSHSDGAPGHRHTWWGGHVHDEASPGHQHGREHPGHAHSHEDAPMGVSEAKTISLKSLFILGITGGIVPCPAALVVLLGALAIHRIAFGMFLIVAFSVGLAAVLVSFGLAMVYARRFINRFESRGPLTERWLPLASSAVITVIGVTIAIQSLVSAGVFRAGA